MFLFDLLVPPFQVVLDLQQQLSLLLVLAELLIERLVVVVTLPVDRHEFVKRLLQFLLGPFQCIILTLAALKRDF